MAVKVFPDHGKAFDDYDKAQFMRVQDGHLFVTKENINDPHDVVAIYAPGKWHHVKTEA
jgi:hypothetical protein